MKYRATQAGEHPTGLHWTEGEERELGPEAFLGAPVWLVPVEDGEIPFEAPVAVEGA